MLKLREKLKDYCDNKIHMIVICKNKEEIDIMMTAITHTDKKRIKYEFLKNERNDEKFQYCEMAMPYNRYLEFMKHIRYEGYDLKQETTIGVIRSLVRFRH